MSDAQIDVKDTGIGEMCKIEEAQVRNVGHDGQI